MPAKLVQGSRLKDLVWISDGYPSAADNHEAPDIFAGPCRVFSIWVWNHITAGAGHPTFIKLYDAANASYVSRPLIQWPVYGGVLLTGPRLLSIGDGLTFETALTVRVTTEPMKHIAPGDNGVTDCEITIVGRAL